jgi:hypothetical protein
MSQTDAAVTKSDSVIDADVLRCGDIQVRATCKWQLSALPVLVYLQVHSAPVLESYHFGRYAPIFDSGSP